MLGRRYPRHRPNLAAVPAASHPLVAILEQVTAGLRDPRNHYLVLTSYLEILSGSVLLGSLHLHQESAWELVVEPDALTCEVLLSPYAGRAPVRVAYASIWQVQHSHSPQFGADDEDGLLYIDNRALDSFAREGMAE